MKEHNNKNEEDDEYVEPPELREAGVPPLRKQINWFTIGVAVILVIVLIFAVYFYYSNN
ncbi:MAG TPA: hypothetical protein VGW31_13040 [Hanamia sp.]|jgi:uncharacterized integral membrane protein|nr:hypothetical protein [Hanamia sp.]